LTYSYKILHDIPTGLDSELQGPTPRPNDKASQHLLFKVLKLFHTELANEAWWTTMARELQKRRDLSCTV